MADEPTQQVRTTRQIVDAVDEADFVSHDPDGSWEVSGDTAIEHDNCVTCSMAELVERDAGLREVSSLPVGWSAMRIDDDGWSLMPPDDFVPTSTPPEGLLVHFRDGSGARHVACGEHAIDGADCPNCNKPMLRMLSLDTTDERLGLQHLGVAFVHLLFCWTCNLAQDRTAYELLPLGGVRLLGYQEGGCESDFPYEDYPRFFDGADVALDPVTAQEAKAIARLNDGSLSSWDLPKRDRHLATPRHQVGGKPLFLQGEPAVLCPKCSAPMSFIACCGDATPDGRGYTGNELVQVVFMLCARDRVVVSYQECD